MMRHKLAIVTASLLLLAIGAVGCTQNIRARAWGGTAKIDLPAGKKLVNITFKESNLWILTRVAKPNETPEVYELTENSSFGLLEGTVVIRETK